MVNVGKYTIRGYTCILWVKVRRLITIMLYYAKFLSLN